MKNILLLLTLFPLFCTAQNPDQPRTNHWYFGDGAGLDFSTGTAVADTTGKLSVLEGSSTMSDLNGNLLMYTDGKTVWNAQHDTMENGTDIGVGKYATPRDATIIIPKPFDNNIYYIFTVDGWENQFNRGMRYTTVDISYNNGLGKVIEKNHLLFTPATEQLAATRDADGCGYWVVSHEHSNANWRAYHLTSSGVDTVPALSTAGQDYGVLQQVYILNGGYGLRFSPNGQYAISVDYRNYLITQIPDTSKLLKFDKQLGMFTNLLSINVDTTGVSCAFSPDNSKLYIEGGYNKEHFNQYDLSSGDSATILSSKISVYQSSFYVISQDMKIGKDGRIYLCTEYIVSDSLSTIDNPNEDGAACNVHRASVWLMGRQPTQSLPNFVSSFPLDSEIVCHGEGIQVMPDFELIISPNPANDFISLQIYAAAFPRQCRIYNAIGYLVLSVSLTKNNQQISTENFPEGIYLLQLKVRQNQFINQKFLIKH